MPSYNLLTEPWIPILRTDGTNDEIGLLEAFSRASSIHSVVGSPLESATILRLLLAIAHATKSPATFDEWSKLWEDRTSFLQTCVSYLSEHECWDLFDSQRPFLQDGRLKDKAKFEPVEPTFLNRGKLGTDPFVSHSSATELALTPAQAARALLVTHAFAVGGTGTPNPLLPKRSGQQDKYSSASLIAQKVVAFADIKALDKFLILNLVVGKQCGTPGWLRAGGAMRNEAVLNDGVADLYSRPAVSALLSPETNGTVRSACVTIGSTFTETDSQDDPLIPHMKAKEKFVPFKIDRYRALWRSADTFLAEKDHPLPIVDQLRRLARRGVVVGDIGLRVIGISGNGKVKHYLWREETLPLGHHIIIDEGSTRLGFMQRSLQTAMKGQYALRTLLLEFAKSYLAQEKSSSPAQTDSLSEHVDQMDNDPDDAELGNEVAGYSRDKKEAEKLRAFIGNLAGFEKQKRGKDTVTVPLFSRYWAELAPMGERIACDDFDEDKWNAKVREAAEKAFRDAVDRLPADARRFRGEYAVSSGDEKKKKKVKSK